MSRSLYTLEFYFLAGMLAFLTLSRSLEAIFFVGFAVLWLSNRYRDRQWGGAWNYWDTLIALWMLASAAVTVSGAVYGLKWNVIGDFACYSTLLWLVSRSSFTEKQLVILFVTLIVSALIGLSMAYYHFYFLGAKNLEISQIGYVNHTAIYLELVFVICLSTLLACWSNLKGWQKIVLLACLFIFLNALFDGLSRAALATALGNLLVVGLFLSRRKLLYFFATITALALIVLASWIHPFQASFLHPAPILEKEWAHEKGFENTISDRAELRQVALWVWEKHPTFGAGIHNFQAEAKKVVAEKSLLAGHPITLYPIFSHAHNIYLNTLAEQGIVGLIALALIFIAWFLLLLNYLPTRSDNNLCWSLWLSSCCVFLSNAIIGWVNTPLHHQNALLSLLLLGLSIAYFKRHLIR